MPSKDRIVVIEDDPQVRRLLLTVIGDAGYDVVGASDGLAGLKRVREKATALVLLDFGLPGGLTGLEICRRLRADPATAGVPIIVLTGQEGDAIELSFLEQGADDYIRKHSFKAPILLGRIQAVLRRVRQPGPDAIRMPNLVIRPARREVIVEGKPVNLTPSEFDILYKLASSPDRVLSRKELLERGEDDPDAVDRTVDVHVLSIRRKLGRSAWMVSTVWGVGYRLGITQGG